MPTTLSADEACKLLNIHRATLYEKARAGEIPGAKIGRGWVFIDEDLIQYIRGQYKPVCHDVTQYLTSAKRLPPYSSTALLRPRVRNLEELLAPKTKKQRRSTTTK